MSSAPRPTVLITGASGLLGRELVRVLASTGLYDVVGSGRGAGPSQSALPAGARWAAADLCAPGAASSLVSSVRPAAVVHAAAERRPDACEAAEAAAAAGGAASDAEALNVDAAWEAARAACRAGAAFVFVSTDYVFDGSAPPYAPCAAPRPLNAYGRHKLRGERATAAAHPGAVVLRVPLLYGPSRDVAESAGTVFARAVVSRAPAALDDWQIRVPTLTTDVARTAARIVAALLARAPGVAGATLHYSAPDRFTRYSLALRMAALLGGAPTDHLTPAAGPPPGAPRPRDADLDCAATRALGLFEPPTPFDDGMRAVLAGFVVDANKRTIV